LVVRLIGLLMVFASQKIVHNVRDEMAEFLVLLRKFYKFTSLSLTFSQVVWLIRLLVNTSHQKNISS